MPLTLYGNSTVLLPEAVTLLLGGEQGEVYRPTQEKKEEPKSPLRSHRHIQICGVSMPIW